MKLNFFIPKVDDNRIVEGIVIANSSDDAEEFGSLFITSEKVVDWTSDWLGANRITVRKAGRIDDLVEMVKELGIKDGADVSEVLGEEHSIVVEETTVPRYASQRPKRAGADGDVLCHDGEPVYRNTRLVKGATATHIKLATTDRMSWKEFEDLQAETASKQETAELA